MLESANPGQVVGAAWGLLGAAVLLIRVWSRAAVARHQRRAMSAVATALATCDRAVRATQRGRDGEWSIELDAREELPGRRGGVPGRRPKADSTW